jgi:DNA-binding NtrC family response regulator
MRRIAQTDATVLIEGETGTGKELAARALHYLGARRQYPFVPVNCGAIPENLIENELFGHERGAYTDARAASQGMLRLAHRGTLFLDEIDSLPLRAQVVLLRFLQDKTFRALGSSTEAHADVRIIAASNANLEDLTRTRAFRADLYHRLRTLWLSLPPLRDRPGDAELLAAHFIRECAARYGVPEKCLHPTTRDWLRSYSWPGNVRELENLIHREFLLSDDGFITVAPPACEISAGHPGAYLLQRDGDPLQPYQNARTLALESFDRDYLSRLLVQTRGNVTHAARLAGKERRALGKLIKRYGIHPSSYRD